MKLNDFIDDAPGELVPIPQGHAFIPHPLPPGWRFPLELWPLLGEAKQKMGLLEGLGKILPNPAILLRPLAGREAILSSRLEGTFVTPKELLLFELEPKESATASTPLNNQREVHNYRRALEHGMKSGLPLSMRLIRELHGILMSGVRGQEQTPGEFRRKQVGIGWPPRFIPPPPERLSACLNPLDHYIHSGDPKFDPLVRCFLCHYQFEAIHPFNDGNGRVGRLLLAMMIQQGCGLSKPWLYMSEYFEARKDEYIDLLYGVSARNDWASWIRFCLGGVVSQADATARRCELLVNKREAFVQRVTESGGSTRLVQIIDMLFDSPFVQITDVRDRLGITYPTAKSDLERLEKSGIVTELKDFQPKVFVAHEVFDIAYDDLDYA